MYKIDLHTHSIISHDGGITKKQFAQILRENILDFIAITDHNQTNFARTLNAELGPRIIIGEEIKTLDGEIIGLFLKKTIKPGMSAFDTISEIQSEGGLVYIPHPYESGRDSIQENVIESVINEIDIIEVFNGRGILRGRSERALGTAQKHNIAKASSSDAHCKWGIGSAFSTVEAMPDRDSLKELLKNSVLQKNYAKPISLLCPTFNKIKNKLFV